MFDSQSLLYRKGPLRRIWVAAHFPKRLKKNEVAETDISSCVDEILKEEFPDVPYRVLGYLLLGIARIYSKKVKYLLDDCHHALLKINDFEGQKNAAKDIATPFVPRSITRPKRFELDAFDLQILGDKSSADIATPFTPCSITQPNRFELDAFDLQILGDKSSADIATPFTPYSITQPNRFELDAFDLQILGDKSSADIATPFTPCSITQPNRFELDAFDLQILGDKSNVDIATPFTPCSITQPNRFELDAFDLQILGDKSSADIATPFTPCSITQPNRFELDAFDLQILGDKNSADIRSDRDIILTDVRENEVIGHYSFDKNHSEDNAAHFTMYSEAHTPVNDVLSPYMENNVVAISSHSLSSSEASIEKLRCNDSYLEECLDPTSSTEVEEEAGHVRILDEFNADREQINPETEDVTRAEKEPQESVISLAEVHMNVEQEKFPKLTPSGYGKCHITTKDQFSFTAIDLIHGSKGPASSAATAPEFMCFQTPATKEKASTSRKRKRLFDNVVILSNKVLKDRIEDSGGLVRKRRKVPHTALEAWRAHKISHLAGTFMEPSIPCVASEHISRFCWKKLKISEAVEIVEASEKIDMCGSPTVQTPDDADNAPSTPLTCSTSLTSYNSNGAGNLIGDEEIDACLIEEIDSRESVDLIMNGWSARTRTVALHLDRSCQNQKKQGQDEEVSLSRLLKQKTKGESARLFYEILVLKSGGYIDVKQEEPFNDILVQETPKLKQACEADVVNPS
ncbi:sister chromatid cohesion 1 protein 2-like [Diospyros lotus]|uniref:sister chromatid cohesion 1 protein 2-like n=1 Tax=Diospyros lotus TaxID=55363 RepID=UPI00224E38D6|nr:sister chromatid cohesion 1 protein 2-like [Diospyros lotus]